MDVRTSDGSIVKISTGIQDQDLAKTLGVEMVQNMYKVNVDDINQLLAYHEVFGKLQGEINAAGQSNLVQNSTANVNQQQTSNNIVNNIANNIAIVTPKNMVENEQGTSTTTVSTDSPPAVITGNHVCDICGKMFQFRYQLIVHRRYHTERKPFTCQVRFFFFASANLESSKQIRKLERLLKIPPLTFHVNVCYILYCILLQVCGKAFTNAQELGRHGKCHLGGSMFTCAVCFHVFANAASLERHMKRHSTDKPYNCSICGKSFARKEHLDNHTRCHTGETPYRCQYCAKVRFVYLIIGICFLI